MATHWIQGYPCKKKKTHKKLILYCSYSYLQRTSLELLTLTIHLAFTNACEDSVWIHDKSTPHLPETNGINEGAARRVKAGTSTVLVQARYLPLVPNTGPNFRLQHHETGLGLDLLSGRHVFSCLQIFAMGIFLCVRHCNSSFFRGLERYTNERCRIEVRTFGTKFNHNSDFSRL